MKAYELGLQGRDSLTALSEVGFGYQLIELAVGNSWIQDGCYIVFNAELLIEFGDFIRFLTGNDPQNPARSFDSYAAFKQGIVPPVAPIVVLPSAPKLPSAVPPSPWPLSPTLVAASTSGGSEVFWRLSSVNPDPRLVAGALVRGTYLTSDYDIKLLNTGFGAVGRYALPSPFPASYLTECHPGPNETFHVGTNRPNFGQAGGGVELLFPNYAVSATYSRMLPNW